MGQGLGIAGIGLVVIELEAGTGEVAAQLAFFTEQGLHDHAAGAALNAFLDADPVHRRRGRAHNNRIGELHASHVYLQIRHILVPP